MRLLKSILMLSIFNVAFAKIKIESVANRGKKVNLDINNKVDVVRSNTVIPNFSEEIVPGEIKKSNIIWPVEFLNYSSGFNPFRMKLNISKKTNIQGHPINLEAKGIIDKVNSGYANNTFTHGYIMGNVYNERFGAKIAYEEKEKELLAFDIRKEHTYDIALFHQLKYVADFKLALDMNFKNVTAKDVKDKREFSLKTVFAKFNSDFGFPELLNMKWSVGASHLSEIISDNEYEYGGSYRLFGIGQIGFTKVCDFVCGTKLALEYKYPSIFGYGITLVNSMKVIEGVVFKLDLGYESLEQKLLDLISGVSDFDILAPKGLIKESGFKSDLSGDFAYSGLTAKFSLKPSYMFDKITPEVVDNIAGLPLRLINLKYGCFLLDLATSANYKLWNFTFGAGYNFFLDNGLAFRPSHLIESNVRFDKKTFFVSLHFNYKSSFYVKNNSLGDLVLGYFTFDLKTGFSIKNDLDLRISVLNFTNTVAEYKKGFKIDQIKFKLDLQYNF